MKWYQKPVAILIVLLVLFPALGMSSCNTSAVITSSVTTTKTTTTQTESTTESTLPIFTEIETTAPIETTSPETSATTIMQTVSGGVLRVHYLDVGQADSEFIELPDGKTMLIDAGNKGDGSNVVSYIKNLGYSTIDYLVATHPHEDHIGGMAEVINSFAIGEIYMPKVASTTQAFENLLTTIQDKGYSINTAQAGVQIAPGINILSPGVGSDYGDELNDWSAVISIVYGSKTFLFLGDAGSAPESTFSIDADVVKVAHHGSRTAFSNALYKEWSPDIAIISVGKDNSYGLPDEEVLQGLADVGTKVYRTDENGTIVLESDGSTVTLKSIGVTISLALPTVTTKPTTAAPTATTKAAETAVATVAATTAATTATPAQGDDGVIVYKTNTGSCYHNDGCSSLSKSKIPITLAEAKAEGLKPCSKCNPPQ
jgi:competence protein ComEC